MDHKERVRKAMERHHEKLLKEQAKQSRGKRNEKPERDLVQIPCVAWMRGQGWNIQIFESKATLDEAGRWRNSHMRAGNFDCQGTLSDGIAAYVEFKAPGKLSTFRLEKNYRQQEFAKDKIRSNAFVAVVDSADLLQRIYVQWRTMRNCSMIEAQNYLTDQLP